jgi:hypothetical protein
MSLPVGAIVHLTQGSACVAGLVVAEGEGGRAVARGFGQSSDGSADGKAWLEPNGTAQGCASGWHPLRRCPKLPAAEREANLLGDLFKAALG